MEKFNDEGIKLLMNAVVIQAVKDYRQALYRYNTERRKDKKQEAAYNIGECELFFRKNISAYCDINGEKIIQKVKEKVREALEKKGKIMEVPDDHRGTV